MVDTSIWCDRVISNTDELIRELLPISATNGVYVFRGQPDASHSLRSSIDRVLYGLNETYCLAQESYCIREFRRLASGFLSPIEFSLVRSDDIAALTVMRHYGVPTRLLDWTNSAWVAAYFACADGYRKASFQESNGAIWVIDLAELKERVNSIETRIFGGNPSTDDLSSSNCPKPATRAHVAFSVKASLFVVPVHNQYQNPRMVAQQGLFTFASHHQQDHDAFLSHLFELPNLQLGRRIVIPSSIKPEVLRKLSSMNITPASLFPGADGVGATLRNELMWK